MRRDRTCKEPFLKQSDLFICVSNFRELKSYNPELRNMFKLLISLCQQRPHIILDATCFLVANYVSSTVAALGQTDTRPDDTAGTE